MLGTAQVCRGIDWLYFEHCFRGKSKAGRRQGEMEREVNYTAFARHTIVRQKRSSCRAL